MASIEFKKTLNTLLPSNQDQLKSLSDDIEKAINDVKQSSSKKSIELIPKDADGTAKSLDSELVLLAPPVTDTSSESSVSILSNIPTLWETAKGRLKLYYAASYLISFILLAGSGFNELYWSKPTFGANAWWDYMMLLSSGFGAEATRSIAVQVARKTDESDN